MDKNKFQDFRNQKTIFRNQEYTTCLVELLIPSTILKAKYNLNNPIVKKSYLVQGGMGYFSSYKSMFENEVKYLTKVSGNIHFPKIIFVDNDEYSIYMEYCGSLTKTDIIPLDWKLQLKEILETLTELGIYHNDFTLDNLIVLDGNLTLIDFTWADTKVNYPFYNLTSELIETAESIFDIFNYLSQIRDRDFYDKELNYSSSSFNEELELSNSSRPTEIHTIIVWDTQDKSKADRYLQEKLPNSIKIVSSEILLVNKDLQNQIALELYKNPADNRVKGDEIYLIIVEDTSPTYQLSKATACIQVLNTNMQKIKNELRTELGGSSGAYFKAHSSYNMEESKLVLDIFNKSESVLTPRKSFTSLREYFNTLNSHPTLKYIVQRGQKDLASIDNYRDTNDIDIVVNDYYLFKAITGAESNNKIYMRENDDGFYIQNNVLIEDIKVAIDVRYIGDNYYNFKWQFDMLETRMLTDISGFNVYIPNRENEFYSLIYHILVQKHGHDNSKHYARLNELIEILKLKVNNEETIEQYLNDLNRGWTELFKFLVRKNYTSIEKPKDVNVGIYTEPFNQLNNSIK